MSVDKVIHAITNQKINIIRFEHADLHGISRSKLVPARHFEEKAVNGLSFPMRDLGRGIQTDAVKGTGYNEEVGYCDALMFPDYETFRVLPWRKNTGRILMEPTFKGELVAAHPRVMARRQLEKLKALGYLLLSAHEFEFHVVDEITRKPRNEFISLRFTLGMSKLDNFIQHVTEDLPKVGVDFECVHTELGPGVIEISYKPSFGIRAADNAYTYRISIKEIAQHHGLIASFMTQPFAESLGNSSHFNHSLWDATGQVPLLYDANNPLGLSKIGRHWIAGILAHAPAIQVLMAPTVNCLKTVRAGIMCPINVTWGADNRTVLLRTKINGLKGTYIENRAGTAGSNPYLSLAATVAAGLDGFINKMEPPPQVTGCAFDDDNVPPNTASLPTNMGDALKALAQDEVIRDALGEAFIKTFTAVKMHEAKLEREALAKGDSNWEMDYFFDIL